MLPPRYVRQAYTYGAKQAILRELETLGFDRVVAAHWPNASPEERHKVSKLLYSWRASHTKIEAVGTVVKRKAYKLRPSGVGFVLSVEAGGSIGDWVRAMLAHGVPVSQRMIQLKAVAAANDAGIQGFAASYDWLDGFKRRQRLSLRTRGAQGQQPPENLQVIAEAFALEVAEMATKLGVKEIWNADETAVFFELIPRKTIDITGTKTVWVRCAGAEKRRVSVLLLGSSRGRKKPHLLS